MTEFETPEQITLVVDVLVGDVQITASDRSTTVVNVGPTDPARRSDVTAAEQTRVEHSRGRVLVRSSRRWRASRASRDGGSVDVQIELPTGSDVSGTTAVAAVRSRGSLGSCRLKTAVGDIHLDECAAVELKTATGDIAVERVAGNADISTSTGAIRVGDVGGTVVIKNSNGDTRVGKVAGDLRVSAAKGDIEIQRAAASVGAKTAKGEIHIDSVARGPVVAETGLGEIAIGVADGTAAWLDLSTGFGELRNLLDRSGPPDPGEESVQLRARTGYGDITIRRS